MIIKKLTKLPSNNVNIPRYPLSARPKPEEMFLSAAKRCRYFSVKFIEKKDSIEL